MEQWIARALVPLAAWILLSGLDDLFVNLVFFWNWLQTRVLLRGGFRWPTAFALDHAPRRRIAIFVPLWREHQVIGKMLDHNLGAIRYDSYDVFLGVYPNDAATLEAVRAREVLDSRLHIALCPHPGPTSKADCLNWICRAMLEYEQETGSHFDVVVTHDAEDLIHPESLRLINYFSRTYDMVQIPVLALPTPAGEWTHGVYCDDFAEFQSKDIPVRRLLGGFLPSNGVGTGYSRAILEKLAAAHEGQVFEPECLTEDYENGYRIHRLGGSQLFIPIGRIDGSLTATREYFPRSFRPALKQRTRWTMGIALQSWQRHGWRAPLRQLYWFWRDRKGLVGNIVSPLTNLLLCGGVLAWISGAFRIRSGAGMRWLFACTLALAMMHLAIRTGCVARIYGVRFALGVPFRAVFGNWLNGLATVLALAQFCNAKRRHRPPAWLKTEHVYPGLAGLSRHKRRLGEILVARGALDAELLKTALGHKPPGERLGAYLLRMGVLDETSLYEALGAQQNLPFGLPGESAVVLRTTRALPAAVVRKWKVLPFRVAEGALLIASPELPSEEMTQELGRFSRLQIRYHLVTPGEFEELARRYLPEPPARASPVRTGAVHPVI